MNFDHFLLFLDGICQTLTPKLPKYPVEADYSRSQSDDIYGEPSNLRHFFKRLILNLPKIWPIFGQIGDGLGPIKSIYVNFFQFWV